MTSLGVFFRSLAGFLHRHGGWSLLSGSCFLLLYNSSSPSPLASQLVLESAASSSSLQVTSSLVKLNARKKSASQDLSIPPAFRVELCL